MSVGLQRLRDEPDVIRQGAIDKGEDPAIVDRALELDAERRRPARRERRRSRRSATPPRSRSARRSGRAPRRTAPRSPTLKAASTAAGERIAAHRRASSATVEAELDDLLLRIPNPADPDVPVGGEEANVTVRTWGELLPRDEPLSGEVGADARPAGDLDAQAALGARRGARHHRQRRAARRSPAPASRSTRAPGSRAPARAHQLVPRRPHARERLHRGLAAGRREQRRRRAAPARSRTRKTRCTSSPATTCT